MWRPDRHEDQLSEQDVRELEVLDMVLTGAPLAELDSGGEALARLVGAVCADHPPLREDFADELDSRVRGRFAEPAAARRSGRVGRVGRVGVVGRLGRSRGVDRDGGVGPGRGRQARGRVSTRPIRRAAGRLASPANRGSWLVGLGAAASLAVGAVVVQGGLVSSSSPGVPSQTGSSAASDSSVGGVATAPQSPVGAVDQQPSGKLVYTPPGSRSAPATAAGGTTQAPTAAQNRHAINQNRFAINGSLAAPAVTAPQAGSTPAGAARAVESDASLALVAPRGRVQQVADGAIAATDRLGGIVETSNVTVAAQGGSQATLALEVPSGALDRTLAAISALAHVSSRAQDTQDITDPTNAARQRLTESRDERTALLRQLGRATTPNQVASIRGQLGLVDGRIANDEASLQKLVGHASMASVSVTVAEAGRAVVVGGDRGSSSPWRPAHALVAALGVLEAVFAVLVVGLAGVVPAAALAVLAWWAVGVVRRRRRQGALARVG